MLSSKLVIQLTFSVTLFMAAIIGGPLPVHAESSLPSDKKGIVFIVGGVGGFDILGAASQWELPRVGVHHEIRDVIWTHGWGQVFRDLQDRPHLLRQAAALAEEVQQIKKNDPARLVYLVGKSGGAGVVLAAAERLPPGSVERIILLSAAVSPNYDLRPAFRAARGEVVSFHSPYDQFMLRFHNFLKENGEFQRSCTKQRWEFPPGSTWVVFTDMVSHAVLAGQFALEQTFIVSRKALLLPHKAPIHILEKLCGCSLTSG